MSQCENLQNSKLIVQKSQKRGTFTQRAGPNFTEVLLAIDRYQI